MLAVKKPILTRKRYAPRDEVYGTAEQRLGDALVSGGKDVGDLMDLLSVMGTTAPQKQSGFNINFDASPDDYYNPINTAAGFSYVGESGQSMYQPPSVEEGKYLGTGRMPTADDVWDIAGTTTASSSQMRNAAKLMRDPAVMQYFMDMYSEPAKAYSPNTVTLRNKAGSTERSEGSKNGVQCTSGKPLWLQRLMGCPPNKTKSWTQ